MLAGGELRPETSPRTSQPRLGCPATDLEPVGRWSRGRRCGGRRRARRSSAGRVDVGCAIFRDPRHQCGKIAGSNPGRAAERCQRANEARKDRAPFCDCDVWSDRLRDLISRAILRCGDRNQGRRRVQLCSARVARPVARLRRPVHSQQRWPSSWTGTPQQRRRRWTRLRSRC